MASSEFEIRQTQVSDASAYNIKKGMRDSKTIPKECSSMNINPATSLGDSRRPGSRRNVITRLLNPANAIPTRARLSKKFSPVIAGCYLHNQDLIDA
jgi:hypothetical protein